MTEPRIEIDLAAFAHNVRTLAAIITPARTMLAVKADAYGHGMLPLARTALEAGADSLAVLEIQAGLHLRQAGVAAPLFAWLHGAEQRLRGGDRGRHPARRPPAPWQLEEILRAGHGRIHLKVDTGLHRNGANPEDWPELVTCGGRSRGGGAGHDRGDLVAPRGCAAEDDAEALTRFHDAVAVAKSPSAASRRSCTSRRARRASANRGTSSVSCGSASRRTASRRSTIKAAANLGLVAPMTGTRAGHHHPRGPRHGGHRESGRDPAAGDRAGSGADPGRAARHRRASRSTRSRWT